MRSAIIAVLLGTISFTTNGDSRLTGAWTAITDKYSLQIALVEYKPKKKQFSVIGSFEKTNDEGISVTCPILAKSKKNKNEKYKLAIQIIPHLCEPINGLAGGLFLDGELDVTSLPHRFSLDGLVIRPGEYSAVFQKVLESRKPPPVDTLAFERSIANESLLLAINNPDYGIRLSEIERQALSEISVVNSLDEEIALEKRQGEEELASLRKKEQEARELAESNTLNSPHGWFMVGPNSWGQITVKEVMENNYYVDILVEDYDLTGAASKLGKIAEGHFDTTSQQFYLRRAKTYKEARSCAKFAPPNYTFPFAYGEIEIGDKKIMGYKETFTENPINKPKKICKNVKMNFVTCMEISCNEYQDTVANFYLIKSRVEARALFNYLMYGM